MSRRFWALLLAVALMLTSLPLRVAGAADPAPAPAAGAADPVPAPAAGPTAQALAQSVQRAETWLDGRQNADGSWGARDALLIRDTATVLLARRSGAQPVPGEATATAWLAAAAPRNTDAAARRLAAIAGAPEAAAAASDLVALQNSDGGWGVAPGFTSDPLDTALGLAALSARIKTLPAADTAPLKPAAERAARALLTQQNGDGAWGVYPGGPGAVFITATVALALHGASAPDVGIAIPTTATLRGARWLLQQRTPAGAWGAGTGSAALTALAYRAALLGAPAAEFRPVTGWLVSLQQPDGSWGGDPYATARVLEAIAVASRLPDVHLGALRLGKQTETGTIPADRFAAYETVLVDAGTIPDGVTVAAVAEGPATAGSPTPEGSAAGSFTPADGNLAWNTGANPPGTYHATVLLREAATGLVLDQASVPFTVEPTVALRSTAVVLSPARTTVGQAVSPQVLADLKNGSNVAGTLQLTASVAAQDGHVFADSTKAVSLTPGEDPVVPPLLTFTPDVAAPTVYTVTVTATNGAAEVARAANTFVVLPPPPPTRVDISKRVTPTHLMPGEGDVAVAIRLQGQGDPNQRGRDPLDVALTIDTSPSMTWGDKDDVVATPSRLDAAKAASKAFIDMLEPTDRGAIVSFSWWSTLVQGLTYDKALLRSRIDNRLPIGSGTAIGVGIQATRQHLTSYGLTGNKKVMLLLSDGGETLWPVSSVLAEADRAKNAGIVIFSIGLGASADRNLLSQIAQRTGGRFYFSPTIADLGQIMADLGGAITRPAGANVRVTDTIPASGITVGAVTPAPYSVTPGSDSTVVEWRFNKVSIDEALDLGMNLHLTGLKPGETREVNHSLVMTYVDQNGQAVRQELGPYSIAVAEALISTTLAVDKPEYGPGEAVAISATLHNDGAAPASFQAVITIVDAAGSPVTTVLTEPVTLAGGADLPLAATWQAGTTLTGAYKATLRLVDGATTLGAAEQPFRIRSDSAAGLKTTTDKALYRPGEEVQVLHQVTNASTNQPEGGLTVVTTITGPDGTAVFTTEPQRVPELAPGARAPLSAAWPADGAQPGSYTVRAVLQRDGQAAAERTVSFEIRATGETGAGLSGTLTVTPASLLPSGDLTLAYTVTNKGNSPIAGARLQVVVADPETGAAVATLEAPVAVAAGETAEGSLPWAFDDLAIRPHLTAMSLLLANGVRVPLASSGFTVVNPFELTATLGPDESHRILVWTGPGPAREHVTGALTHFGYAHKVVTTARQFQAELRSGVYTAVVLALAGAEHKGEDQSGGNPVQLDRELKEKVYGGMGLILFGGLAPRQEEDHGGDPGHERDSWVGAAGSGSAAQASSSAAQASSSAPPPPSGPDQVGGGARPGGGAAAPRDPVSITYGLGHVLWVPLDAGRAEPAAVEQVLGSAVPELSVPDPTLRAMGPAAVTVDVTAGPLPVTGKVALTLPAGAAWLDTAELNFALAPGESQRFRLVLRLPPANSTVKVTVTGAYLAHGTEHRQGSATATAAVAEGLKAPIDAVRTALAAFPAKEVRELQRTLDELQARPPGTARALEQAIQRLLADIPRLERLKGGDPRDAHLAYVKLLSYYQARWAQGGK